MGFVSRSCFRLMCSKTFLQLSAAFKIFWALPGSRPYITPFSYLCFTAVVQVHGILLCVLMCRLGSQSLIAKSTHTHTGSVSELHAITFLKRRPYFYIRKRRRLWLRRGALVLCCCIRRQSCLSYKA